MRFEDEHHHPQEGNNSGGVQVVRSRARVHDPIDLKSALKTSLVGNERKHNGLVNGGDIERCGLEEKPVNNLDNVEYKSTYPIDEPINPPSSVGRGPDLVSPTAHHPFPPRLLNGGAGTCVGNTYPVDKECCDVNRPCEDHGEMLDESNEDDEEDGEADDDDEEGGGVTHSHDLEGLENGECRQRHFYEKVHLPTKLGVISRVHFVSAAFSLLVGTIATCYCYLTLTVKRALIFYAWLYFCFQFTFTD